MKLVSLNAWGGKIYKPLIDFIKKQSKDTDIFCFQEIFNTTSNKKADEVRRLNLYEEISKVFKNHHGFFAPSLDNYLIGNRLEIKRTDFNLSFGLAIFVKKDINVNFSGDFFVFGSKNSVDPNNLNTIPRNVQYISFKKNGKQFTVCNLHGIWLKEGKKDTPSRIEQSKKIKQFLDQQVGEKILCGDFNLDINTNSLKILEIDLINLIKEFNIPTTRSKHYPHSEKYADYILVSPDIKVLNFQVPNIEISDHLPMILEFD